MPEKLSFLGRVGLAITAFAEAKSVTDKVNAFTTGSDVDDGGAKISTPYAQSAWVYIAVSRLAEKVSSIPFRISQIGGGRAKHIRALRNAGDPRQRAFVRRALGETIIESGDAVDLFERPHPTMNRQLFWEMVVTWNCLRGEFFVLPLDVADNVIDLTDPSPRVKRLIVVPTGLFSHIVSGYELQGWRYTGSPLLTPIASQFLLPGEVIHSRTPNPYQYWRGMSPLMVAMLAAGADYAAAQYAKGYWLNNADTGVIVTTEQQADDTQQKQILAALNERKRKAGTADRPLFLWGGAKVEKPQLSGMEQQFIENRKMNRQEIGAIFKVSDAIMGFSAATALSGGDAKKSEEQSFIENTIEPLCCHLEAAVAPVITTFGDDLIGWFDVDSLPVMQDARRARIETAVKMFSLSVPMEDINANLDLDLPMRPWYKKGFLAFNLQDASGDAGALPGEDDPNNPPADDAEDKTGDPFSRMGNLLAALREQPPVVEKKPDVISLWKKHITARKAAVKMFQNKTNKVLLKFRARALQKLSSLKLADYKAIAGIADIEAKTKSLVDVIFSAADFGESLNHELEVPLRSTLQSAGEELMDEVGNDDPWKYPPKAVHEFLDSRRQKIQGCGDTVRAQLNNALRDGVEAGETHDQIAARVKEVFNNLSDAEARRIAMTEVNVAYNTARQQAMDDAGVQYKAWLSSHGPNVRQAHADAEDQYIETPILLDEPFEVGGEQLMFPGDDSLGASPGNTINCQCIQLAALKAGEDEKSVTFKIFGVGEMKFQKRGGAA